MALNALFIDMLIKRNGGFFSRRIVIGFSLLARPSAGGFLGEAQIQPLCNSLINRPGLCEVLHAVVCNGRMRRRNLAKSIYKLHHLSPRCTPLKPIQVVNTDDSKVVLFGRVHVEEVSYPVIETRLPCR